jgi:hypothetical protein
MLALEKLGVHIIFARIVDLRQLYDYSHIEQWQNKSICCPLNLYPLLPGTYSIGTPVAIVGWQLNFIQGN